MSTNLETGTQAPNFSLQTDNSGDFSLADQQGKATVIFFYPKDDTEGCTIEAIEFTGLKADFASAGANIIGISPDSVEDHAKFREKFDLGIDLGADPDHKAIGPYGVWGEKTNFGKKYMGLIRTTYLVDAAGKIAGAWTVNKVKGHAAEVLKVAKALNS